MKFPEFSTRPWGVAAHSLMELSNLQAVFNFKSEITKNKLDDDFRSRIIDNYMNDRFEFLSDTPTQLYKRLTLSRKNNSDVVDLYVKPDGIWIVNNIKYIIEVKTIQREEKIRDKMEGWLRQIACNQLPNTNGDTVSVNEKYILIVIIIGKTPSADTPAVPYTGFIFEVVLKKNLETCKELWNYYFEKVNDGDVDKNMVSREILNEYYARMNTGAGELCFNNIEAELERRVNNIKKTTKKKK